MSIIPHPIALEVPPSPTVAEPPHLIPKLIHLQVLRAIAASLVVADHAFPDFISRGLPAKAYVSVGYQLGHLGVSTFFVLSGLIMMRQSANLFGIKNGPFLFAYRRLIRIVPMYWIATFACFIPFMTPKLISPVKETILSLFFIPNVYHAADHLSPLLGQGWTLNYEMTFYVLFAIALFLPRTKGVLFLLLVPEVFGAVGRSYAFPYAGVAMSLANFYTNPVSILFARGVLIGAWESAVRSIPRIRLPFSPAYFMLIPPVLLLALPYRVGHFEAWEFLSVYSILLVLGCTLVENGTPGRVLNFLVLLGDASYSTYLFHLFSYVIVVPRAIRLLGHHQATPAMMICTMLVCVVVANLLGLLIHLKVEVPLTRALRKLKLPFSGKFQPAVA